VLTVIKIQSSYISLSARYTQLIPASSGMGKTIGFHTKCAVFLADVWQIRYTYSCLFLTLHIMFMAVYIPDSLLLYYFLFLTILLRIRYSLNISVLCFKDGTITKKTMTLTLYGLAPCFVFVSRSSRWWILARAQSKVQARTVLMTLFFLLSLFFFVIKTPIHISFRRLLRINSEIS